MMNFFRGKKKVIKIRSINKEMGSKKVGFMASESLSAEDFCQNNFCENVSSKNHQRFARNASHFMNAEISSINRR